MNLSDYIKTKEWRKKRLETFFKKGKKCMKCGSEKQIHVHHATYERIGNECIETDLFPLCKRCHNYFHKHYEGHFIENTLDYLKEKFLPKYEESIKVPTKKYKPKAKKKTKIRNKNKKFKVRKPKKVKEPFVSTVYNKTQGKKYTYNSFRLF